MKNKIIFAVILTILFLASDVKAAYSVECQGVYSVTGVVMTGECTTPDYTAGGGRCPFGLMEVTPPTLCPIYTPYGGNPINQICCASISANPSVWPTLFPSISPPQWPAPTIEIHCRDKETGTINPNLIDTALGCIPTDFNAFVVWFLQRAIGISGGIAFLLMILGGFKILTSAGDPKGVQAGGEMITSAITGLLFIIFSVFLLELIGVKILGIPGL